MRWIKCHRLPCTVAMVLGLALFGFAYHQAQVQERPAWDCAEAQEVAATALVAIRGGDVRALAGLVYTRSNTWNVLVHSKFSFKIVGHLSTLYGLKSLADGDIRRSLRVCEFPPGTLMDSLICCAVPSWAVRELGRHPTDAIVFRCDLQKHSFLVICVREASSWKLLGLPVVSTKALRYRTIYEASAHNDAVAD